jgi:hypothetical protein
MEEAAIGRFFHYGSYGYTQAQRAKSAFSNEYG